MSPFTPDPTGTVVLCGSVTRAVAALDAAEAFFLAKGRTVHKPVADPSRTPAEHEARWFALIDACRPGDLVVGCTMQHQPFGSQTMRELHRAMDRSMGLARLWVEPADAEERAS